MITTYEIKERFALSWTTLFKGDSVILCDHVAVVCLYNDELDKVETYHCVLKPADKDKLNEHATGVIVAKDC